MNDDHSRKPNGTHGGSAYNGNAKVQPDSLIDVVSEALGGAIFEMQTGLFNLGRNRALQSGTTEPREEDTLALTEHARAMARQTYREKYDPSQNVHDAMHETEYRRDIARREEAEKAGKHSAANLRDAEIKVARTPKAGPKPCAHPSLIAAFIVAIMLSVAPTLHDSIFITIGDDLLNWFGSGVSAVFVGIMLTLAILSGRRTKWTWVGVVAGVIFGLGLWAVRLSGATGAGEAMVATGLTIIEIAAVLLLEWLASGLRASEAAWLPIHEAETGAIAGRDAAQTENERWQSRVKDLTESITGKIAFVTDRHNRNIHLPELEAVANRAVLDGYNAGITENIGRLLGVTRRTE
jgi:hypothetical protein